jgi:mediator of RNA polymerase II transcription subunit 10
MQVLADIDNARNPMQLTRERLERAATENQFMNGKIAAIDVSPAVTFSRLLGTI